MQIYRDFTLSFEPEEYLAFHGERMSRVLALPDIRAQFEQAFEYAHALLTPMACLAVFPIRRFLHSQIELADGTRLGGGPVVEVMGGAEELVVAVCTVGPEVDRQLRLLRENHQGFTMLVLDELAGWGVDQIRQQLCQRLEAEQQARGRYTSTVLSPGESTWSLQDQRVIFRLLDTSQIGVHLSPGLVMVPLKSLSMIVGLGSRPMGVPGMTNCDYCSMKDRCKYARTGGHGVQA
ncbi:MAG: hypothetical protein D6775_03460 [Caldilineae bacterium]|nr:MAG: hypothetical protein D6775_03460 [Caldilineae bacterium]